MQVFNAKTQQLEDVIWSTGNNSEIIATFADGHFYKFPAGLSQEQLQTNVDQHKADNEGQEVITPEILAAREKAAADSAALVNSLNGNTMPVGAQSNAQQPSEQPAAN